MASCILPDCVRCASSTKTKMLPLAAKSFGMLGLQLADERRPRPRRGPPRSRSRGTCGSSEQISHSRRLVQRAEQVGAAGGAVDRLVDAVEDALDLLVELGAVGDEQHAGVLLVLANPLGQPHHRQRLARALGVPDDAALALGDPLLRGLDAEVLVVAAGLLDAGVEDHEVVDRSPAAGPCEHSWVSARSSGFVDRRTASLPRQPVLLRRVDDRVAQALDIVAGHDELHRREERPDELRLLVADRLPDALRHRDLGALQLQRRQRRCR